MKRLFVVLWLVTPAVVLRAQSDVPVSNKNHIGFNTAIIINNLFNGEATPFTLMYKHQNGDKKALRMGLGLAISRNNETPDPTYPGFFSASSYSDADVNIGYEWLSPITEKWVWYKGADLFFRYYTSQVETYDDGQPYTTSDESTVGGSINPFLGIRFNIGPKLYLSTEVSLQAAYYNVESTFENFSQSTVSTSEGGKFQVTLRPATGIFFFYRF
jgi:hypothetical protein